MAMSRSFGATPATSRPPISTRPAEDCSNPAITLSSVDLPQPEGPTRTTNSPFSMSRSIPLRTSTDPSLTRNAATDSADMPSVLLDGARGQAAKEILSAEDVDQQSRNRRDQDRRAFDAVFTGLGDIGVERHQRRSHRAIRTFGERDAEEKLVPDVGELPDHRHDQDRRRQRQDDVPEDLEKAGAVDLGGSNQVERHIDVEVAAEQRREADPPNDVDQDQRTDRVGQVEFAQRERPGHELHLRRQEYAEGDDGEQRRRAAKAPQRKNVSVHGADQGGHDRRRYGDDQRVP